MRRPLPPEDARLWSLVTATVRPHASRVPAIPDVAAALPTGVTGGGSKKAAPKAAAATTSKAAPAASPKPAASAQSPASSTGRTVLKPHGPPGSGQFAHQAWTSGARPAPEEIEPRRKRRISMAREPIAARLDLHGMTQDQARAAVHAFVARQHADGARAVLVITGKGAMGDGVLRRRVPEWLAEAVVRPMIAGLSAAERRHGGDGALYVALRRRHR